MPRLHFSTTGLLAGEPEPVNMQAGRQAGRQDETAASATGWHGDVLSVVLHAE